MTASAQMTIDPRYILPFDSATDADHPRMGGKCASLARMIALGAAVAASGDDDQHQQEGGQADGRGEQDGASDHGVNAGRGWNTKGR